MNISPFPIYLTVSWVLFSNIKAYFRTEMYQIIYSCLSLQWQGRLYTSSASFCRCFQPVVLVTDAQ